MPTNIEKLCEEINALMEEDPQSFECAISTILREQRLYLDFWMEGIVDGYKRYSPKPGLVFPIGLFKGHELIRECGSRIESLNCGIKSRRGILNFVNSLDEGPMLLGMNSCHFS